VLSTIYDKPIYFYIINRIIQFYQWFQVRGSHSFCWYWLNCWPSLFKISFITTVLYFWYQETHIYFFSNYLSPEIIEQLPLTWNHWTTATSHLKSLNNNYLSPEIIEQQLPLTWEVVVVQWFQVRGSCCSMISGER
jgi:hypothetical protein